MDTGSNGSLIAEDLAEKYEMKWVSNRGTWTTNNGNFKTTSKAVAHSLTLPQFSCKRTIRSVELSA